jgi:branched-chain amino acid transport system ATP-binding protein
VATDGDSAPLLRIAGLAAGYGQEPVLRHVSLQVLAGQYVAVVGPNGSGKSTLVGCLLRLLAVRAGGIWFDGQDITGELPHRLVQRGLSGVPQGRTALHTLSVADNLVLGGYLLDRQTRRRRTEEVLDRLPQLRGKLQLMAGSLSGGEQQLLEMGRALMVRPRLLVLDEPTIGLSPEWIDGLLELLAQLRQRDGLACLLVEQATSPTLQLASAVHTLDGGVLRSVPYASSSATTAAIATGEKTRRHVSATQARVDGHAPGSNV